MGDGDLDIVAGSFRSFDFSGAGLAAPSGPATGPLVIWENLGLVDARASRERKTR